MNKKYVHVPVSLIERAERFDRRGGLGFEVHEWLRELRALLPQMTPTAELHRIEDMVPGTRFSAATPDGSGRWRWTLLSDGRVRLHGTTEIWYPNSIDPSTIRDVTPPKDAA